MAVFDPFDSVIQKTTINDNDKVLMYVDSPTKNMQWTTVASIKGSTPSPSPVNGFNPTIDLNAINTKTNCFSGTIAELGKEHQIGKEPHNNVRPVQIGNIYKIDNTYDGKTENMYYQYIDIVNNEKVNIYCDNGVIKQKKFDPDDINAIKLADGTIKRLLTPLEFKKLGLGSSICKYDSDTDEGDNVNLGHFWFWTVPNNVCMSFLLQHAVEGDQLIILFKNNINDSIWKPFHIGKSVKDDKSYEYSAYLKTGMIIAVSYLRNIKGGNKLFYVGSIEPYNRSINVSCYPIIG